MNDFVCNILLALVLLGEAKGSKTLDLDKVRSFSTKVITFESQMVVRQRGLLARCMKSTAICCSAFPKIT